MKALVTGGAGFIGSNLVEALVRQGDTVTVLDDFSVGDPRNVQQSNKVRIVNGNVADFDLVHELVAQSNIVYHLAVKCLEMCNDNPMLAHRINAGGTFNVCVAALKAKSKVVYISSSEIYGTCKYAPMDEKHPANPQSIYGVTKLMGEEYVRYYNQYYHVPAVIIRPFNSFGPNLRDDHYSPVITSFIRHAQRFEPLVIEGSGEQSRDFTYVSDTVDGILLLSKLNNGETVNIGSGKAVSINHLAEEVLRLCDVSPEARVLVHKEPRINDVYKLEADITRARELGYKPKVSFEDGLKKYVEWLGKPA